MEVDGPGWCVRTGTSAVGDALYLIRRKISLMSTASRRPQRLVDGREVRGRERHDRLRYGARGEELGDQGLDVGLGEELVAAVLHRHQPRAGEPAARVLRV